MLVIEADSRVAVQEIPDADSEVMITGLRNGWEYHFVVIATGLSQQYTADAITSRVTWLGEDLYTGARPSASAPTRMHILCQTGNVDAMALLADCDDPNAAPMAVGTIAAVSVTEGQMTAAMDVSGYFSDADMDDTLTYTAMSDMEMYATVMVSGSMVTITGVAAGTATITVTATDAAGDTAMQTSWSPSRRQTRRPWRRATSWPPMRPPIPGAWTSWLPGRRVRMWRRTA